ncbi:BTAD domain-containing putative transcriptional regulator [Micromonospora sp. CPCC 206061]|uniref:BTAD domain-containing putative transcriptional regulator n=1 Tax=Micromonospora sp. CPCC 206061 TaxID=3122410 RepID=UPI002FF1CFBA
MPNALASLGSFRALGCRPVDRSRSGASLPTLCAVCGRRALTSTEASAAGLLDGCRYAADGCRPTAAHCGSAECPAQRGEVALKRFEILGPVRAFDGVQELDLGPTKQRAVLAVLLLNANKPVSTTQIIDSVWQDDPPENGANVVQKYIAGLRRVLEPERSPRTPGQLLTFTPAGYVLSVPSGGLDADAFHERVRRARAEWLDGRLAPAAAELRSALALWRADALAGLSGPVFDSARDRLTEARASALEAWSEVELEQGGHATLVPELARLVAEYPLREQLRYCQMLALYRSGRQAEALAAYREARAYLSDEFGVEPGERLQQLHQRILRSDPALAPAEDPSVVLMAPASPTIPVVTPNGGPVSPPWAPQPPLAAFQPQPPSGQGWRIAMKVCAIAVPLLTVGTLTWMVVLMYALQRRSKVLIVAAVGYLLLAAAGCAISEATSDEGDPSGWFGIAMFLMVIATLGGAFHVVLLSFVVPSRAQPDPRLIVAIEQRARRQQALQLASQYPAVARELNIGRPDLPRVFDDGGLIDINAAPAQVLTALPGMNPHLAERVVAERQYRGAFGSIDDLVSRGTVPPEVAYALREHAVALR